MLNSGKADELYGLLHEPMGYFMFFFTKPGFQMVPKCSNGNLFTIFGGFSFLISKRVDLMGFNH